MSADIHRLIAPRSIALIGAGALDRLRSPPAMPRSAMVEPCGGSIPPGRRPTPSLIIAPWPIFRLRPTPRSSQSPIKKHRRSWGPSPRGEPGVSCASPPVFRRPAPNPASPHPRTGGERRLPALLWPQLLRIRQLLRPRRHDARPDRGQGGRFRRGIDLSKRHHRPDIDVQSPLAAHRLSLHRRQSNAAAVEDLFEILCEDPRVTAFGLYLEGIKDPSVLARAAERAHLAGKPIAIIKSGRTAAAVRTARSHTGALAGADEVFEAFCRQAGICPLRHAGDAVRDIETVSRGRSAPGTQKYWSWVLREATWR